MPIAQTRGKLKGEQPKLKERQARKLRRMYDSATDWPKMINCFLNFLLGRAFLRIEFSISGFRRDLVSIFRLLPTFKETDDRLSDGRVESPSGSQGAEPETLSRGLGSMVWRFGRRLLGVPPSPDANVSMSTSSGKRLLKQATREPYLTDADQPASSSAPVPYSEAARPPKLSATVPLGSLPASVLVPEPSHLSDAIINEQPVIAPQNSSEADLAVAQSFFEPPATTTGAELSNNRKSVQALSIDVGVLEDKIEFTDEWAHDLRSQPDDHSSLKAAETAVEDFPQAGAAAFETPYAPTLPASTPPLDISPDQRRAAEPERLTASEIVRALQGDCKLIEIMSMQKRLDARDAAGASVLHIAARRGHLDLYTGLIAAGADILVRDQAGRRAYELLTSRDAAMISDRKPLTMAPPEAHAEPDKSPEHKGRTFKIPDAPEAPFDIALDEPGGDITFDAQEGAVEFNHRAGFAKARADFRRVEVVERIDGKDGGEFSLADNPASSRIRGDDLADFNMAPSDGDLERPRSSTFLSVSRRRPGLPARAASTEGFHLPVSSCREWIEHVIDAGGCSEADIDDLVSLCRGDFSAKDVRANLKRALDVAGFVMAPDDPLEDSVSVESLAALGVDALVEALSAAATRTNRVPGDEAIHLSKRRERALFHELNEARHALVHTLIATPEAGVVAERILTQKPLPDENLETADKNEAETSLAEAEAGPTPESTGGRLIGIAALSEAQIELAQLDAITEQLETTGLAAQALDAHRRLRRIFDEILILHLPLARRFAVRRTADGEDVEDLFQDCVPALQRAIWKFDPELGNHFQTYAVFWMRQALLRSHQNVGALVRIPVHRHELLGRLVRLDEERERQALPMLPTAEAASLLEVEEQIIDQLRAIPTVALPFDETFLDDHAGDALESVHASQRSELLDAMMEDFDNRQKDIIRRRFGLDGDVPETLEEIGEDYGVTRERIRQIEAKALRRLGHPARLRALRELL